MFRARVFGLGGFEKDFAIRKLPAALCADEPFLQRFIAAANAAARLHGDRISRVQEVDAEDGAYYLVSDLARGLDLALVIELLRTRLTRLPRAAAIGAVIDACDALVYAHGRRDLVPSGVLHLGLSPHSLIAGAEGELRVIDLGLIGALVQPGWTERHDVQSRIGYLAPEVVVGQGAGPQADVYSLGAILHELTGGSPDDPDLHAVMVQAMAAEPAKRFSTVIELRDRLIRFMRDRAEARRMLGAEIARYQSAESGPVLTGEPIAPAPQREDRLIPTEPGTPPPLDFDATGPLSGAAAPRPLPFDCVDTLFDTPNPSPGAERAPEPRLDPRDELDSDDLGRGNEPAPERQIPRAALDSYGRRGDEPASERLDPREELDSDGASSDEDPETAARFNPRTDATPLRAVTALMIDTPARPGDGVTRPVGRPEMRERGRVPTPIATPPIPSPPTLSLAALRRIQWPSRKRMAAGGGAALLFILGLILLLRPSHRVQLPSDPKALRHPVSSLFGRAAASEGTAHEQAPAGPQVQIASRPRDAHVFVDGALRGTTPLSAELSPGVHRVVMVLDGYKVWSSSTNAAEISATLEPAELPAQVAGSHGLKIRCHTADLLRIQIDGFDTGVDCPNQEKIGLSSGRHQISLYNPLTDETVTVQREVSLTGTERSHRVYLKY